MGSGVLARKKFCSLGVGAQFVISGNILRWNANERQQKQRNNSSAVIPSSTMNQNATRLSSRNGRNDSDMPFRPPPERVMVVKGSTPQVSSGPLLQKASIGDVFYSQLKGGEVRGARRDVRLILVLAVGAQ